MQTVADLMRVLDQIAPPHMAYPDDPIGLQVGQESATLQKCMVALDSTRSAVAAAAEAGCQALISHHAPIYNPLKNLVGGKAGLLRGALRRDIALIAAHTNWDAAPGGVNDTLAGLLDLANVRPFGADIAARAYKMVTFVPEESLDPLLDALAAAGAGEIGLYRRCAFFNSGTGTYEPQPGANPVIGEVGQRESTPEVRVEMRVPGHALDASKKALLKAHPYDEPAYDIWEVTNSEPLSLPRMGDLPEPLHFREMRSFVERALNCQARTFGDGDKKIARVAVIGGAGGSMWQTAQENGCDALVTGEVRHHEALEATEHGFCVVDAGHYHTEHPGMISMRRMLEERMPDVEFVLFEPEPGACGRPR